MFRTFVLVVAATLSLQFSATPATAEDMSLAGWKVTIDPIPGYCPLDKSRTDERLAFSFVEERVAADGQLLAYWFECATLEAMRKNAEQGPVPYILVIAAKKNDELFQTGIKRQEVVDQTRDRIFDVYGEKEFPADLNRGAIDQINSQIKAFIAAQQNGQAGATEFLGFMGRDSEGLYYATAQQNASNKGGPVLASVTALTKVKQFVISAVSYELYVDGQTFFKLRDRGQTVVQSLIANNPFDE